MTLVNAETGEVVTGRVPLDDVQFDMSIYPRSEWSARTVERYAESLTAGETLPPIVVESGTSRLLDGLHRWKAHRQVGETTIEVERHVVPDGVPAKLYAASLSARHGDRMTGDDLKQVARETFTENPEFSMSTVARLLGVHRETVGRWCGDISDRRRAVTALRAVLLVRAGWSQTKAADFLGVNQSTVSRAMQDVGSDILHSDVLTEALIDLPDECESVADLLREELVFARWSDEERDLLKKMQAGETVVVNLHRHADLIGWAEDIGRYVRVDRKTQWGNPFILNEDGDRAEVIAAFADYYLPNKPSLLARLDELQGKALGCWCAPEACHADILKDEVDG